MYNSFGARALLRAHTIAFGDHGCNSLVRRENVCRSVHVLQEFCVVHGSSRVRKVSLSRSIQCTSFVCLGDREFYAVHG